MIDPVVSAINHLLYKQLHGSIIASVFNKKNLYPQPQDQGKKGSLEQAGFGVECPIHEQKRREESQGTKQDGLLECIVKEENPDRGDQDGAAQPINLKIHAPFFFQQGKKSQAG